MKTSREIHPKNLLKRRWIKLNQPLSPSPLPWRGA
nr:MAG TPA: hypothetical protein [Caudoviricetes sp.]